MTEKAMRAYARQTKNGGHQLRHKCRDLVNDHVKCNVTPLIVALAEYGDEWAWDLLHGNPEGPEEVYPAYEVWVVSSWLAMMLQKHKHRTDALAQTDYWARGATGQAICLDTVIEEIVRERT